jgi:hypothetical protein
VTAKNDKEFGDHCLEHTHPEFRQRVKDGAEVVVAGKAFGCGSSRQEAVQALLGMFYLVFFDQITGLMDSRDRSQMCHREVIRLHLLAQPAVLGPPGNHHQGQDLS